MSRGTHLSGVGFLDGRLPLLHDCFLRRRRGSIGVRSVAMGSPDEARGGFGVPEAGRIARRGGEQFQRPGRGGAGSAVEGNRAPSETSWSRMFTSDRPMSPDTSVRRECGALRRMEQCRSLFDISQENAREKKSSQPASQLLLAPLFTSVHGSVIDARHVHRAQRVPPPRALLPSPVHRRQLKPQRRHRRRVAQPGPPGWQRNSVYPPNRGPNRRV